MKTWRELVECVQLRKHDKNHGKNQEKIVERTIQWEEIRQWVKNRSPLDASTNHGMNGEKTKIVHDEHPDPSWNTLLKPTQCHERKNKWKKLKEWAYDRSPSIPR